MDKWHCKSCGKLNINASIFEVDVDDRLITEPISACSFCGEMRSCKTTGDGGGKEARNGEVFTAVDE